MHCLGSSSCIRPRMKMLQKSKLFILMRLIILRRIFLNLRPYYLNFSHKNLVPNDQCNDHIHSTLYDNVVNLGIQVANNVAKQSFELFVQKYHFLFSKYKKCVFFVSKLQKLGCKMALSQFSHEVDQYLMDNYQVLLIFQVSSYFRTFKSLYADFPKIIQFELQLCDSSVLKSSKQFRYTSSNYIEEPLIVWKCSTPCYNAGHFDPC